MIKLAVSGCLGRMGQRITELALADSEFKISALLESPQHPSITKKVNGLVIQTDPNMIKGSDVLIEFTTPEATMANLTCCIKHNVKMVIGTTGLSAEQIEQIKRASKTIPIVFSSNMSVGVNIVFAMVREAARKTGKNYSVRIVEAHHIHKKDKPSGTAKTLGQFVEEGSGIPVKDFKSIREGEIIGDHDVIFESPEDIITVRHHAKNRDIFVKGALVAAKFVAKKKTGLFSMQDIFVNNNHDKSQ